MSVAIGISTVTKDFRIGMRGVKLRAVDNLSLTIEEGQVYGLLGPNGSGKSTTLKLLLGLLEPTRGQCRLFGQPSGTIATKEAIGFLPEAPYFYQYLTGRELLRFYARLCAIDKKKIDARIAETLALVRMEAAADRRVSTYSKGMLQRIGLAQALVHDPKLLILDEPTAGVDPIGAAEIATIIQQLKDEGKTILLCSHLLAQVEKLCDRIAIMHRGKLILEGSVSDILERSDNTLLRLSNVSEETLGKIREQLNALNVSIEAIDRPKLSLDELFVEKVKGGA